jgi:hypothetical protein
MVMLFRDFGPFGITFMTMFGMLDFPVNLDEKFSKKGL